MFGQLIKKEREKRGVSVEELSSLLNIEKELLDRYEKDKSYIPFTTLLYLSKIFKKPLGYFFQDVVKKSYK